MSASGAVLFDQDGCLADSRPGIVWSYEQAFQQVGQPCPEKAVLVSFLGPPLVPNLQRYYGEILRYEGKRLSDCVEATRKAFRFNYDKNGGLLMGKLYEGIPDVLREIKELGARVCLATSKSVGPASELIRNFGLDVFFDGLYGSEPDGTRGDKGELIAYVLDQQKLSSSQCLMVGDRKHDVIGGTKNGMPTIGALWGYGSADELLDSGAMTVAARPSVLPQIVVEHFRS